MQFKGAYFSQVGDTGSHEPLVEDLVSVITLSISVDHTQKKYHPRLRLG